MRCRQWELDVRRGRLLGGGVRGHKCDAVSENRTCGRVKRGQRGTRMAHSTWTYNRCTIGIYYVHPPEPRSPFSSRVQLP
eukprot:5616913-Pyramimonas_sp.AAC.1